MKKLKITVREAAIKNGVLKAYRLQKLTRLSPSVAARVWRGELTRIDLDVLAAVMNALKCDITDIIKVVSDEPEDIRPLIEILEAAGVLGVIDSGKTEEPADFIMPAEDTDDIEPEILDEPEFEEELVDVSTFVILEEDEPGETEDDDGK